MLFSTLIATIWLSSSFSNTPRDIVTLDAARCIDVTTKTQLEDRTTTRRCSVKFEIALDAPRNDLALLVPLFRDSLVVTVNDYTLGREDLNQWRMPGRLATVPAFFALPPQYVSEGDNRLEFVVTGFAAREPVLGHLFLGPHNRVLAHFQKLWFVAAVAPTLLLGAQTALGLIFLIIWNRRREEVALGWLALFLLLDTVRGTSIIPAPISDTSAVSYWSLLVPFSAAAYLMFARALVEVPTTYRTWLVLLPPTMLTMLAGLTPASVATTLLLPIGVALVSGYLIAAIFVLWRGLHRGNTEARLLFLGSGAMLCFVVHDVLLWLQLIDGQVAIARPGLFVLLIAIALMMINRFTSAMLQLDAAAENMQRKANAIETELRQVYDDLREQHERTALAKERSRLMRDLHDGLGGEMVAILALIERGQAQSADIAHNVRAALVDMRLIVASLEDYGGDIAMALGAWKERADPLVQASGLRLHWLLTGLSPEFEAGPTQTLNLLRILQEALSNAIRHSRASNIYIEAEVAEAEQIITFADDGIGLPSDIREGKGLPNMRSRIAALGGTIEFLRSDYGTTIRLSLPLAMSGGRPSLDSVLA